MTNVKLAQQHRGRGVYREVKKQNVYDLKKSEGFGGKSLFCVCVEGLRGPVVLELLQVARLLSSPNEWETVQQISNSSLHRAGRGISAPQAPSNVLNCVKPRNGPPSNRGSMVETSALCMAAAAKLTRCSAAHGKGQ